MEGRGTVPSRILPPRHGDEEDSRCRRMAPDSGVSGVERQRNEPCAGVRKRGRSEAVTVRRYRDSARGLPLRRAGSSFGGIRPLSEPSDNQQNVRRPQAPRSGGIHDADVRIWYRGNSDEHRDGPVRQAAATCLCGGAVGSAGKVTGAIGHGWAPERDQSHAVGPVQFVVVHFFPSRGFQWKHMGHQNLSPLRSPGITSVRAAEDCC